MANSTGQEQLASETNWSGPSLFAKAGYVQAQHYKGYIRKSWIFNTSVTNVVDNLQGPVVQSVVSLTSLFRVISLTVLADSIYNILKFQHICVSLDVNFNESLTNDIVSFEQVGPDVFFIFFRENKTF